MDRWDLTKGNWLEIRSISITRLKLLFVVLWHQLLHSWNQKYLDYEIETQEIYGTAQEKYPTWNQKYLDYEIETGMDVQRQQ